jgi:hypothetical protein
MTKAEARTVPAGTVVKCELCPDSTFEVVRVAYDNGYQNMVWINVRSLHVRVDGTRFEPTYGHAVLHIV